MRHTSWFAVLALALWPQGALTQERQETVDRLKAPIEPSARTQVLILASEHLSALGQDFDRSVVVPLVELLERFEPDAIAVESMPPQQIAKIATDSSDDPDSVPAQLLAAFAADAHQLGRQAQASLGIGYDAAWAKASDWLSGPAPDDVSSRRDLVLHLLAAYDLPSALLQWSFLDESDQSADDGVTTSIADFLNDRLEAPNEVVSIALETARRRKLNRLYSIDDHIDDEMGLRTGLNETLMRELSGNPAYEALIQSGYLQTVGNRLPEAAMEGDLLPLYRHLNSPEAMQEDVSNQWHLFFRTALPSKIDRARVALWEARNLNIAGHLRLVSAWHSGGRVLVVIGAAHKPFLDRYFLQMLDVEVVQLDSIR
jgi:hypothetical protein